MEKERNELGGVLVDGASRSHRLDAADRDRNPHRLLADVLALALEISGRGRGRASHRPAADRARFLCPGGARFAEPARPLVGISHWPHAGIHFRRAGDRVVVIRSAIRRCKLFAASCFPSQKPGWSRDSPSASRTRWANLELCSWWEATFQA